MEKTPAQIAAVERLREWGIGPTARQLFQWGTPGDFERCTVFYREHTDMPGREVDGWCARLHKLATGEYPGPNAHGGEHD